MPTFTLQRPILAPKEMAESDRRRRETIGRWKRFSESMWGSSFAPGLSYRLITAMFIKLGRGSRPGSCSSSFSVRVLNQEGMGGTSQQTCGP